MNAWLGAQRVRVLIPLVWTSLFAVVSLSCLIAIMAGVVHHFYWRELVFGTCLVTLSTVTGIKTRQK